jgi:hypothetical protein
VRVREAPLDPVQLERGDAEVEQHRVRTGLPAGLAASVLDHDLVDGVVHRLHQPDPVAEAGQPLSGQDERLGVTVEAHHPRLRAAVEDGLGVPAQPHRRVDQDGAGPLQCRRHQVDDPVQQDRDVSRAGRSGRHVDQPASFVRSTSAQAVAVDASRENAITYTPSRASSRTRRRSLAPTGCPAGSASGGSAVPGRRPLRPCTRSS